MGGIISGKKKANEKDASDAISEESYRIQGKKSMSEHQKIENIQRRRLASRIQQKKKGKEDRGRIREHVMGDKYDEDQLRDYKPKIINKTPEQRSIIKKSLDSHFLFSSLPFAQIDRIIDAMGYEKVKDGEVVINQGDDGDKFYIIENGKFDIYVNNVLVVTYHGGQNFGELALMYNCPRAATIRARGEGTLFVLDRLGFHYFMKHATIEVEHDVTDFVTSIKFLSSLGEQDMQNLIDSFTLAKFADGEHIVTQGDQGDVFYIIEEGTVDVVKDEKTVISLTRGEFFGERALLENKPRAASCVARGPVSCLALLRAEFEAILGKNLSKEMDTTHAGRLRYESEASSKGDSTSVKQSSVMKCDVSKFEVKTIIGKGAFGMVKLVSYKPTKEPMAMKQMQKSRIVQTKQCKNVIQEKRIMEELDHPFLLRLLATGHDDDCVYLITEFLQGGDIFAKLCDCDGIFSIATTRYYTACVVEAFGYMHGKNIIYRDLKPENLVLTDKGVLKIVDFGMAKHVPHMTFTVCGTPEYMAPEIIHGKGHNKGVDYWALGILVFEMIIGHTPFADPSNNHIQIYKKINRHCNQALSRSRSKRATVEFPNWIAKEPHAVDIVLKFLIPKPTMRLGCVKGGTQNIRRHPWFKSAKFDWSSLLSGEMNPPIVPQVDDKWDACHFDEWPSNTAAIVKYEPSEAMAAYERIWKEEF